MPFTVVFSTLKGELRNSARPPPRLDRVNFFANMPPRDPFADDPNDPPASFLEEEDTVEPLSPEERAAVEHDLKLVQEFARVLGPPRGVDGVFFFCEDCGEDHFYEWDIMAANMRSTLGNELAPVHEPGAQPDPSRYVPWDYALGYLDGLEGR